jgi:hypothetical protein
MNSKSAVSSPNRRTWVIAATALAVAAYVCAVALILGNGSSAADWIAALAATVMLSVVAVIALLTLTVPSTADPPVMPGPPLQRDGGANHDGLSALGQDVAIDQGGFTAVAQDVDKDQDGYAALVQSVETDNARYGALVEDVVSVVDELERHMPALTPDQRSIAEHAVLLLSEVLQRADVDLVVVGEEFDRSRHALPRGSSSARAGATVVEVLSPGFVLGPRVLRRATVRLGDAL